MQTTTKPAPSPIFHCFAELIIPVNAVSTNIQRGLYAAGHYQHITDETVRLQQINRERQLQVCCLNRGIDGAILSRTLNELGKRLCREAPNLLLGLTARIPRSEMPPAFRDKDIVAAEDNANAIFLDGYGHPCFLFVQCHGETNYRLNLVNVEGPFTPSYAYLVEDIPTTG